MGHRRWAIFLLITGLSWLGTGCTSSSNVDSSAPDVIPDEMTDKISQGERILLDPSPNAQKQTAARAFANGEYQQAVSMWSSTLEQQRNDPETLIYLNNAQIGDKATYALAVPIPGDAEVNVAREILRGAGQAQFQINSGGGINGKPLKLIIANDRNNPDVAQNLATVFSQNSEILAVIGHFSSNVTLEAATVYQEEELVVMSPTSSSVALSNVGSYVFRTVSSDCMSGNALAAYLTDNMNVDRAAVLFNSSSSYSTSMRDVFKSSVKERNGTIVAEFNFSQPNFNIVNALAEIERQDARAIAIFPNSSGMNALDTLDKTLLIAQMNQRKVPLLGSDSLYKPRTLQLGQDNVAQMVLALPWHTDRTNTDFSELAANLWGGKVNWRSALTYDATMALAKAMEIEPTRQGIQQALLNPDFAAEGASGAIAFLPTGDRAGEVQLVEVQPGDSSGFGYDFVPVAFEYSQPVTCQ